MFQALNLQKREEKMKYIRIIQYMHNGISTINIPSNKLKEEERLWQRRSFFLDTVNYLLLVVEYFLYIAVSVEIMIMKFIEKTLMP